MFSDDLLNWYDRNKRELPWRGERDPYRIWLSEIMLQQTRVEAVKGYYTRFLQQLPSISALADAEEALLYKLWEGLGYYSRVRNLQKAARIIVSDYGGVFPREYSQVRALPGIGDYTAGAICSICFDEKTPAVDGNVLRVVTRLTDNHGCTDDRRVKLQISAQLAEIYPAEAGTFTQALMELGATVCLPNGAPKCQACPMGDLCQARKQGTIDSLPVRAEKKPRKQEDMTVFLLTCGDRLALRQRPDSGLLAGLYELPHLPGTMTPEAIISAAEQWDLQPEYLEKLVHRTHIFTHIQWNMTGARLHCGAESGGLIWADRDEVASRYALPTAFRQFLSDIWEDYT